MDQSDSRRSEVAEEAKADFEQKILYQKSYLDLLFDDHLSIYLKGLAQQQFTAKQEGVNVRVVVLPACGEPPKSIQFHLGAKTHGGAQDSIQVVITILPDHMSCMMVKIPGRYENSAHFIEVDVKLNDLAKEIIHQANLGPSSSLTWPQLEELAQGRPVSKVAAHPAHPSILDEMKRPGVSAAQAIRIPPYLPNDSYSQEELANQDGLRAIAPNTPQSGDRFEIHEETPEDRKGKKEVDKAARNYYRRKILTPAQAEEEEEEEEREEEEEVDPSTPPLEETPPMLPSSPLADAIPPSPPLAPTQGETTPPLEPTQPSSPLADEPTQRGSPPPSAVPAAAAVAASAAPPVGDATGAVTSPAPSRKRKRADAPLPPPPPAVPAAPAAALLAAQAGAAVSPLSPVGMGVVSPRRSPLLVRRPLPPAPLPSTPVASRKRVATPPPSDDEDVPSPRRAAKLLNVQTRARKCKDDLENLIKSPYRLLDHAPSVTMKVAGTKLCNNWKSLACTMRLRYDAFIATGHLVLRTLTANLLLHQELYDEIEEHLDKFDAAKKGIEELRDLAVSFSKSVHSAFTDMNKDNEEEEEIVYDDNDRYAAKHRLFKEKAASHRDVMTEWKQSTLNLHF